MGLPEWVFGSITAAFMLVLGLEVLWVIWKNQDRLAYLICEANGQASMSRFQLLVFTFVFATSLIAIVFSSNPPSFPATIPVEVLELLGISGGTYLLSKGIQASRDTHPNKVQHPDREIPPRVASGHGQNEVSSQGGPNGHQQDEVSTQVVSS